MAILGDSKVGKTTLCQNIVERPFSDKYEPTNGCEYYQKIYEDSRNNQMMKIDIFCASGDKKSQKLAKFLYKDAVCVIIMINLNDMSTFNNLKTYIENIRLNSVEDPIYYLVGNFDGNQNKVTEDMVKEFKKENDINDMKFLRISCKNKKNVKDLLDEITKDVLLSEKYYTSVIDKDISDTSSMDDGTKEMEKLGKQLKTFYKETKDKKPNFMRCKTCDRLLYIKFRNTYNEVSFICNYCNTENNISLYEADKYIDQLSSKVICFECLRTKEEKTKLEYCNKCKHYVCPSCKKSIQKSLKQEGSGKMHTLVPYYLMDILCFDHGKKLLGYCKECQKGICINCFEAHKGHENIFYENFVKKLIEEHSSELKTEAANLNKIRQNFEKCVGLITQEFNAFMTLKNKEIRLKEQLLMQLGNVKYNQQLIDTIKNMKYLKIKNLPKDSPWDKMLENIFETIGQPIQIYNVNISKKANNITPKIVKIGEIKGDPNKNINDDGNRIELGKNITDFCSMNNDQYIGISYNTGELEIYEYKNQMRNAKNLSTYNIFINESINRIHKSTLNVNNYLFCGKGKIVNVEFYNRYKTMKTLLEIEEPKKNFQFALDQENFIVACDKNNIILYDKEGKQIGDFTDIIARQGSKEIIKIDEVMNNVIYINYVKSLDDSSVSTVETAETQDQEDANLDASMSREYVPKEQKLTGTKIIEFNEENYKIKRDHTLTDAQEIIGIVNNRLILIRDDEFSSVILFDAKSFKNVQRFYFEPEEKPIFGSFLGDRDNLIGFLLISEQMKMIQNIYDAEHKSITQISGLKLKVKDVDIKKNFVKEGKIILIQEKGFIKFIGENSFLFINYDL